MRRRMNNAFATNCKTGSILPKLQPTASKPAAVRYQNLFAGINIIILLGAATKSHNVAIHLLKFTCLTASGAAEVKSKAKEN